MKTKILSYLKSWLFPIFIISLFIPLYVWKLDSIPVNVTGDENTYLGNVYQILYSPTKIGLFALMGDGSQPATNFYFMTIFVKIFGLNHTIFGLRLSNVFWAIGTLTVFFIIAKEKVSKETAFFTTLLMGTSVWFLNFARNGWFNLGITFWGLLTIYCLEHGAKKSGRLFFGLGGIFAGICFYGYFAGKIYILTAFVFFVIQFLLNKDRLKIAKHFLFFFIPFFIIVSPLIGNIAKQSDFYFRRPSATAILKNVTDQETARKIIIDQMKNNINGLFLLDGVSIGKGTENIRYSPPGEPLVIIFVRLLFYLGVAASLLRFKDYYLWWISYLINFFGVNVLTVSTPNPARAITILPFIFLLSALGLNEVISFLTRRIPLKLIIAGLSLPVLLFSCQTIGNYWQWSLSKNVGLARQPAIDYSEFNSWQNYQIKQIKAGFLPITNYRWYELRKLNKDPDI